MIAPTNTPAVDSIGAPAMATPGGGPAPSAAMPRVRPAFPVLVALADDSCGDAVLAMARALARDRGASPTVVNVVEVGSGTEVGAAAFLQSLEFAQLERDPSFTGVHVTALRRRFPAEGVLEQWPISVRAGDSTASILDTARRVQPDLILMGLGKHGRIARAAGEDTVEEVMRAGIAPVLALPPSETAPEPRLPTRVLVAMDFSAASIRAAHVAQHLMGDHGTMHLVHVRFQLIEHEGERYEGIEVVQTAGVQAAFEAICHDLATDTITVTSSVVEDGDAAKSLLALAATLQPDLIAIGSQRHHWLERLMLGSVARAITVNGCWPVLVTPPRPKPPAQAEQPPTTPDGSPPLTTQ